MVLPSTPMERLSKVVFGQIHRLAVMAWIADSEGVINPTEMAADLGLPAVSAIQNPLRDLVEAGMLIRLPTTAGKTYYERIDSAGWTFAKELAANVETAHPDDSPASTAAPKGSSGSVSRTERR